jgi:hypothetical protein
MVRMTNCQTAKLPCPVTSDDINGQVVLHIAPWKNQQIPLNIPGDLGLFTASFCHSNAVNSFHWLILQLFLFTAKLRDVDAVHSFDAPPKITETTLHLWS